MTAMHVSPERLTLFTEGIPEAEFAFESKNRISAEDDANYSIYPRVSLPADMDRYLAEAMGSATRKNARAGLRRIDAGEFRVTQADAATLDRHLDALMDLWVIKWAGSKGEATARAQAEDHKAMLRAAFHAGESLIAVLWQDDRPIAGQGSLLDRKNSAVICLVGSRDLSIRKPAPGFLLHLHCIRWAIDQRFALYDLQLGNHAYKYDFGPQDRVVASHRISTRSRRNLRDKLEPRSLPVVLKRVKACLAAGDIVRAANGCRQILNVDPAHAEARALLARMPVTPGSTDARVIEAGQHLRAGRPAQAARLLQSVVAGRMQDGDVRLMLGVALLQLKQFGDARSHLAAAAKLKPKSAAVQNSYGCCLFALGRAGEAVQRFDRALALDPDHRQARANRDAARRAVPHGATPVSHPTPA